MGENPSPLGEAFRLMIRLLPQLKLGVYGAGEAKIGD
jgi:hypothetical protein